MKKLLIRLTSILMVLAVFMPAESSAFDKKYYLGQPFKYFDLKDLYNQRWVSTYLRGKPVIILTAHRYQRYEVAQWAEAFRQEFGANGSVHLLWAVNLRRCPWTVSKNEVIKQWKSFNCPIPVLMDWDGVIGRGLRINYQIPNIIVLDPYGRLAMHEMHTFNYEVYSAVAARIRVLCNSVPNYVSAPIAAYPQQPALPLVPTSKYSY